MNKKAKTIVALVLVLVKRFKTTYSKKKPMYYVFGKMKPTCACGVKGLS